MTMPTNEPRSFLCKIKDRLLFVRSAPADDISKLTRGRDKLIYCRTLHVDTTMLAALIEQDELIKIYKLNRNFKFNDPSSEFVISNDHYASFKALVESAVEENPDIKLDDLLRLRWTPLMKTKKKKIGRPKAARDPETGELINIDRENKQIINLWDDDNDLEPIRASIHPTTKASTTKAVEIGKIQRVLRRHKHLLLRPYNSK